VIRKGAGDNYGKRRKRKESRMLDSGGFIGVSFFGEMRENGQSRELDSEVHEC